MKKVVSEKDGYSYFYEVDNDKIHRTKFETGNHMTGQDIADILVTTRARVSQLLKKGIKTIYYKLKNKNKDCSSIQIVATMASVFNVKTDIEYRKFFRLFPKNVRREVNEEARQIRYY